MRPLVATGTVHGSTIDVDHTLSEVDGQKVRITIVPITVPEEEFSPEQNARLFHEWAAKGAQGPIEDDDDWPSRS